METAPSLDDQIEQRFHGIDEAIYRTRSGKDLIKNVQVNIEQSRKENKLDSFLNSLKAALQDINRNITKGTYLRIFWNSSIFVYMFKV